MKSKGKQLGILVFLAVIAVLLVVSSRTPGTLADPENYQCSTYATIFSLLPPVVAIGLALVTKGSVHFPAGGNSGRRTFVL